MAVWMYFKDTTGVELCDNITMFFVFFDGSYMYDGSRKSMKRRSRHRRVYICGEIEVGIQRKEKRTRQTKIKLRESSTRV